MTLDLAAHQGRVPLELLGRSEFPHVAGEPYTLTMPGYGFFWFALMPAEAGGWREPLPEPLPEFVTVVLKGGLKNLLESRGAKDLSGHVLADYLPNRRWFAAKDDRIGSVGIAAATPLGGKGEGYLLAELDVHLRDGGTQHYLLPLAATWGEEHLAEGAPLLPYTIAKVRRGPRIGVLNDAMQDDDFVRHALDAWPGGGIAKW